MPLTSFSASAFLQRAGGHWAFPQLLTRQEASARVRSESMVSEPVSTSAGTPRSVIVIESGDGRSDRLCARLRSIDLRPVRVADLPEAIDQLEESWHAISLLMIPSCLSAERVGRSLKSLSRGTPGIRTYLSYGEEPDRKWRKRLRSAGVTLALWEPYDEALLRFQVSRALEDQDVPARSAARVPTKLFARVSSGERSKDTVVLSLSETGAFLETNRPHMEGAAIELEIQLPGNPLTLSAHARFANVPGNLHRPALAYGMGVRFSDVDPATRKLLRAFIAERFNQLRV